jgi:hypothetical protein
MIRLEDFLLFFSQSVQAFGFNLTTIAKKTKILCLVNTVMPSYVFSNFFIVFFLKSQQEFPLCASGAGFDGYN